MAGESPSPAARPPGPGKKLLVALLSVPLALLLGEGVARIWHATTGDAYDSDKARQDLVDARSFLVDRIPGLDAQARDQGREPKDGVVLAPHPYNGWEAMDTQITRESGWYATGRFDDSFEVLIIGGSVSALTASKGMKTILDTLRADPRLAGRDMMILNHGRGSFKQPQMTLKAAYLFTLGYRPDAVVLIDGFNEVALGYDNVTMRTHPFFPHWGQYGPLISRTGIDLEQIQLYAQAIAMRAKITAEIDRTLRWKLYKSSILGPWARGRINDLRGRFTAVQNAIVASASNQVPEGAFPPERGGAYPRNTDRALELIAESWVEGSIQLDALCRVHDIPFLHVLQPTLHDEGMKPVTEAERTRGNAKPSWLEGARLGYPVLRANAPRIEAAGVHFLDGSDTFKDYAETTYYDSCHFRGEGMEMFARRVAEGVLAILPE